MFMALNITIFSGSGSADNEAEQAAVSEVPAYASYAFLCVNLLSIPVVIVPALLAIIIIVKNKRLQTNNNIFLINLLLTDVGIAVIWCTNGLLAVLYLLGVNVDVDCNLMLIPFMLLVLANKLMFIPLCVYRFIHIAFPFSYKHIVTNKAITITIITLWIVAMISISLYINEPLDYIPSAGICKPTQTNNPGTLILLLFHHICYADYYITIAYTCVRGSSSQTTFSTVSREVLPKKENQ